MLSRDLLLHRMRQGRIFPHRLDPDDEEALPLAGDLVEIAALGVGQSKKDVDDALTARAGLHSKPKISKGLAKLVSDRLELAEPEGEPEERRQTSFRAAEDVRRSLPAGASLEDLEGALRARFGDELSALREALYADLPECRTVRGFRALGARSLLERYDLAQVQGLVLHARRLEISIRDGDLARVRRLLRWLKFCRLVADLRRTEDALTLSIEGPLALLSSTKKYGLQLASFVSGVPILERFELVASIELPRRPPASLRITEAHGLVSPLRAGTGHVPEEIARVLERFSDGEWEVDVLPEPRPVGVSSVCVPDVHFRRRGGSEEVAIELFHRWHRGAVERRIRDLEARPDPTLYLGVDRALLDDPPLRALVAAAPRTFVFTGFPTSRVLKGILRGHEGVT